MDQSKTRTYDVYRDGKRVASGVSNSEVNGLILKDASSRRLLNNTPIIYTLYRAGKLRKQCRVLKKTIVWLKPPSIENPKNTNIAFTSNSTLRRHYRNR